MTSTEMILELETFNALLQRLNRALTMADTKSIFELTGEISASIAELEHVDLALVKTKPERDRIKQLANSIRVIQEANQVLCNSGLRSVRTFLEWVQPSSGYSADGHRPKRGGMPGMILSA